MTYVVVDLGGTKTRVATSTDLATLSEPVKFTTPDDPTECVAAIVDAISVAPEKPIAGMCVGIRGRLSEDKQSLDADTTLASWVHYPLAATLRERLGCPVWLENDTALAGLGEAIFGAGQGFDLVVYHTISTGVGGVRIDYGEIDHASTGFEPGHQILDIDRTILGEDVTPTLENLVSGTAVAERMGVPAYEIPQDDVLWDQLASYLGQGLRNTILYWAPEIIVLGGAMIVGDPRIQIDAIRKHTVAALDGFSDSPFVTMAKLGDNCGLYGALAYITQQTAKDIDK